MSRNWNSFAKCSAIGAALSLAVWIGSAYAKEESVLVNKPTTSVVQTGPVLPPPSNPNAPVANGNTSGDVFAPSPAPTTKVQPLPTPPQSLQQPPQNSTVKRPFMRPAVPREPAQGRLVVGEEAMPMPPGAVVVQQGPALPAPPITEGLNVKPAPPIKYDTDHDARKMLRAGKIDLVMITIDPADGCAYEIPMCIPACCVGDPQVKGGVGILGRGKVEYRWPCGFRAIVKFRHILGDVEVEYEGD